jgi:glycosyltransferase involved in cell wall biosynthesis
MTRHYSDYHTRIHKHWHVRLDRLCMAQCDAVIAVSHHTAEHLIQVEGAPAYKVHVIHNGIDFERVKASPDARGRIRAELRTGEADLVLVMARLHPEKGHEHLFRALPEVRRRLSRPFVILLAGTGPFEEAYRRQLRDLGCEDLVRFLGFRKDAADLMTAADVLVLPSVAEAFGLVLAEALFLGLPVVASRVGGIPEIVADGEDGLLVPPADPLALTDALVGLLQDPARRARLAVHGRAKVERAFSFERMVRAYENVYQKLVPGSA